MKKSWSKPKLVILARASTSELVLITCKGMGINGPHGLANPHDWCSHTNIVDPGPPVVGDGIPCQSQTVT